MPRQIESGVYLLRIKFTNEKDELEVTYEKHAIYTGITEMKEVLAKVTENYKKFAKDEIDITYKFDSRIRRLIS